MLLVQGRPADGSTAALCTVTATFTQSPPGLTFLIPTEGTFVINGVIECDGLVDGHQATGPGPFRMSGVDGVPPLVQGTCLFDHGFGDADYTVKTSGGDVRVRERFSFTGGALGYFISPSLTATYEILPTKGDCITSPVVQRTLLGQGTFLRAD